MTPAAFRRLALALPDTVEGAHHEHPDFRAHGRVFASLHPDARRAMVKVPLPLQQRLVGAAPDVFTPATGAWGRAGCTMVVLAAVDEGVLRDALQEAWQFAAIASAGRRPGAPKAAAKPGKSRGRARAPVKARRTRG